MPIQRTYIESNTQFHRVEMFRNSLLMSIKSLTLTQAIAKRHICNKTTYDRRMPVGVLLKHMGDESTVTMKAHGLCNVVASEF